MFDEECISSVYAGGSFNILLKPGDSIYSQTVTAGSSFDPYVSLKNYSQKLSKNKRNKFDKPFVYSTWYYYGERFISEFLVDVDNKWKTFCIVNWSGEEKDISLKLDFVDIGKKYAVSSFFQKRLRITPYTETHFFWETPSAQRRNNKNSRQFRSIHSKKQYAFFNGRRIECTGKQNYRKKFIWH